MTKTFTNYLIECMDAKTKELEALNEKYSYVTWKDVMVVNALAFIAFSPFIVAMAFLSEALKGVVA